MCESQNQKTLGSLAFRASCPPPKPFHNPSPLWRPDTRCFGSAATVLLLHCGTWGGLACLQMTGVDLWPPGTIWLFCLRWDLEVYWSAATTRVATVWSAWARSQVVASGVALLRISGLGRISVSFWPRTRSWQISSRQIMTQAILWRNHYRTITP